MLQFGASLIIKAN